MSNAGGVNPEACVTALREAAREQGVELTVAMVTGDEFIDKVMGYRILKTSKCTLPIYMYMYMCTFPLICRLPACDSCSILYSRLLKSSHYSMCDLSPS